MPIYEKFIGRHRDEFATFDDLARNFRLTWNNDFNFAYDVLDVLAAEKPDALCMLWVSATGEEKRITFAEMSRESCRAANLFKSLGVRKGERVLLTLKRSYLFWYCMLGLHRLGAVAVQATNMLTAKDYIYRCNAAEIVCAVVTADGDATEHFDEALPGLKTVRVRCVTKHKKADGWLDFEALLNAQPDTFPRPEGEDKTWADDTMLLSFSSGTTGHPKMITHDYTYPLGHLMTGVFWHRVEPGGLHFTVSDTGWLKSLWGKLYGQWLGESAVYTYDFDKFDGADILDKLEKHRITTFCVPPTMYRLMLQHDVASRDLSALSFCCSAGEALNPEIYNKWREATGLKIFEGFGQTETTVCLSTIYPFIQPKPGSMGLPTAGYDMRLLDPDGNECEPGVTGEICIRAESMEKRPRGLFTGYHNNEKDTSAQWHGGFYHTGDTAYRDELGFFWYVGRNDDIIKSSGYRIGPFEVESVLLEHPAVLECAVTGVPDAVRGMNVKATIVLKPGCQAGDELVSELQEFVKKNTAPYKYPRVIQFVDELPKTFNGKVRRSAIRRNDAN